MPRMPFTHAARMKALQPKPVEDRPTASERGYGKDWRDLRRLKLNRDPLCQHPDCLAIATDVDHIVPRSRGGHDMLENMQSLCHSHHSQKTATQDGGGFRRR